MEKLKYDLKEIYNWPIKIQYSVLCIIALVLLYVFYLLDLSILKKQYTAETMISGELKKDLQQLYLQEGALLAEVERAPMLEKQLTEWQGALIKKDQVTTVLDQLIKLGMAAGLHINNFDPEHILRVKGASELPIKVVASGTYDQIASYMSQLVNLNLLVELGDFTISRVEFEDPEHPVAAGPTGSTAPLAVELHLYVYTK